MTVYCFKCEHCGARFTLSDRDAPGCYDCGSPLKRDYRAEGVGIGGGVRVSRDGLVSDQAKVFLPDNSDFAGPGDPEGKKGMRQWREDHQPKGSKPYWPGEVEKTTF